MRIILVLFILIGRLFAANNCADRNIFISTTAVPISTAFNAKCTAGTISGVTWSCPNGGMTAWGFDIPSDCQTSRVTYAIQAADGSTGAGHKYDLGLYYIKGPSFALYAGRLMVHTGSLDGTAFTPAGDVGKILTTAKTWATTADCPAMPCNLPAGQYAFAITTDCVSGCAALYGDENKSFMSMFLIWLGGHGGDVANPRNTGLRPLNCSPTCAFDYSTAPGLPASIGIPLTDPAFWDTGLPRQPQILIF